MLKRCLFGHSHHHLTPAHCELLWEIGISPHRSCHIDMATGDAWGRCIVLLKGGGDPQKSGGGEAESVTGAAAPCKRHAMNSRSSHLENDMPRQIGGRPESRTACGAARRPTQVLLRRLGRVRDAFQHARCSPPRVDSRSALLMCAWPARLVPWRCTWSCLDPVFHRCEPEPLHA